MSEWKAKRFWKAAHVVASGDGFEVALDGGISKRRQSNRLWCRRK